MVGKSKALPMFVLKKIAYGQALDGIYVDSNQLFC